MQIQMICVRNADDAEIWNYWPDKKSAQTMWLLLADSFDNERVQKERAHFFSIAVEKS